MRNLLAYLLILTLLSGTSPGKGPVPGEAETEADVPRAVPFTLSDQFKRDQSINFPADQPILLCFADPDAADHVGPWYDAASARYEGKVSMLGVGLTTSVPRLFRPMLRLYLRKVAAEVPILLDWKGEVCAQYSYEPKVPNILAIDAAGQVRCRINGKFSDMDQSTLFSSVDAMLAE